MGRRESEFKSRARRHQALFRADSLGLSDYDMHASMLTHSDAAAGGNFYGKWDGLFADVKARFPRYNKQLYADMLRSQHIPFNFFVPVNHRKEDSRMVDFLRKLWPVSDINRLQRVEIEYTPTVHKSEMLDDKTSFDAFIEYLDSNRQICGIGIEVKYTEKDDSYGTTEKARMFDPYEASLYHHVTKASQAFQPDAIACLRTKKLKQLWRNHLLGFAMLQQKYLEQFTYCHLYPQDNGHQQEACTEYTRHLTESGIKTFTPLTFEVFIETGRQVLSDDPDLVQWLDYLQSRYLW